MAICRFGSWECTTRFCVAIEISSILSGDLGSLDCFVLLFSRAWDLMRTGITLLPGEASWVRLAGWPAGRLWQQELGQRQFIIHEKRLFLVSYSGCKRKPAAAMHANCQAAAAALLRALSCIIQSVVGVTRTIITVTRS